MPGLSVLDRTRLGRWSLKQQTTEVLLSLVEAATVSAQTAVAAVGSVATRSHQASAMSERYSQASASEVEECSLRRRVTGAGRVWLQERGVAIGEMPGICIVPPQLGSVPTLAFMAEVPIQMEAADDDSASEAGSDAGQANWAEQLEAAEWQLGQYETNQ